MASGYVTYLAERESVLCHTLCSLTSFLSGTTGFNSQFLVSFLQFLSLTFSVTLCLVFLCWGKKLKEAANANEDWMTFRVDLFWFYNLRSSYRSLLVVWQALTLPSLYRSPDLEHPSEYLKLAKPALSFNSPFKLNSLEYEQEQWYAHSIGPG